MTEPAAAADEPVVVARGERDVVRYVFPVEIEVRGGQAPVDVDAVADATLRRLAEGLRAT